MERLSSNPPENQDSTQRQRRRSRRTVLHATVEVLEPRKGEGVTINASKGGLRVAVDCRLEAGDICLLRVTETVGAPRLERARVVWSQELRDGCIAGLQLTGLH